MQMGDGQMIVRRSFLRGAGLAATAFSLSSFSTRSAFGQTDTRTTARIAYSAPGLSYAGIFLATEAGIWGKNGVNLDFRQVQGGPLTMVALTNKEADFGGIAAIDAVIGWEKGIKTLTVAAFTGSLTLQFIARNDWMSRVGVSPTSSLSDKLNAFKGARIGASTIGGGPAQYTRHLVRSVGIDPERDMKILAVGFAASRMAALRANQVDVVAGDLPESDQVELEGFGKLFLNCAKEVPIFREFPYTVLLTTSEFADRYPDVVRRVAQSVGQANDLFHTNVGQAMDIVRKQFPAVDPRALESALRRDKDNFPRGARMSHEMWRNNVKIAQDLKLITTNVPADEGVLWTNKFLG